MTPTGSSQPPPALTWVSAYVLKAELPHSRTCTVTVEIQRRTGGAWRTVRKMRLTDSVKSTGLVSASEARFRLAVPKRAVLRAVLPFAEARPCYVRSFSKVVRA